MNKVIDVRPVSVPSYAARGQTCVLLAEGARAVTAVPSSQDLQIRYNMRRVKLSHV